MNDRWIGFGWTWDLLGLKGFSSGIAGFIEGLSTSTTVNLSDGSSWQFDLVASLINFSYKDASANTLGTFQLAFSSNDRIVSFTDYLGYVTTFTYSSTGDLVLVTDVLGNQTSYEYDSDHLLLARIDPDGGRTDFPVSTPPIFALLTFGLVGIGFQRYRNNKDRIANF